MLLIYMLTAPVLAEIEACSFRNKTPQETASHIEPLLKKHLPLSANSSAAGGAVDERLRNERRKDHYSHFILRLAFAGTEDLRRRFARVETMLFKLRFHNDDAKERRQFVDSLNLDWDIVTDEEKETLGDQLRAATPMLKREDDSWFKVHWTRVPELIEQRTVLVRKGKAYVPLKEQTSMVMTEFASRLDKALAMTTRALPRLDEDEPLESNINSPIEELRDSRCWVFRLGFFSTRRADQCREYRRIIATFSALHETSPHHSA